ncbi:MAG: phosphate ABC transporter substrate-binding protein [Clostridium sp.]
MKSKKTKALVCILTISLMAGTLVGCYGNDENTKPNTEVENNEKKEDGIEGTITSLGSTALQPLIEEAANNFRAKYPKVLINVQGGGSGAGINQVSQGTIEIGNSDVLAEDKLKDQGRIKELVNNEICAQGFAVVTSKDVKVDNLTKDQIKKIFKGEVTNWKEVGGGDGDINIINREASSGTRATFVKAVMDGEGENERLGTTQTSSGGVRTSLKQVQGGIGYLAMSYLTEDVKREVNVIKIDNVEATIENIGKGDYSFWSYGHMYTKGEAKGATKAFIDYIISKENEELIEKAGYIPMSKVKK